MPIIPIPSRPSQRTGLGARILPRALAAACLLTAALTLAGCGSASHHAQVASLPSHNGRSGTRSSTAKSTLTPTEGIPDPDGRPRQTLNATSAQETAQIEPYWHCLSAHHLHVSSGPKVVAVESACKRLYPLPPWQFDPSNPQARAFVGRTVTCLQARGYHARAALTPLGAAPGSASAGPGVPAPLGTDWTIDYTPNISTYSSDGTQRLIRRAAAQDACQRQAL